MRIGIVGCGGMGITHNNALKALSEIMDVEVVALADHRPERLAQAAQNWPDAAAYEEGFDLIEKEKLDAVHICLPSHLHADAVIAAMKKGMDVFTEKPVCLTEEDCERMLRAEAETGRKVMVGQVVRYFKEYAYLKKLHESGQYGALKSLVLKRIGPDVEWGWEDWFHDEKKSGSVVLDLHVHDVDYVRYLLGEPEDFQVFATAFDSGMINHIVTAYRYGNAFVTAEASWDETNSTRFEAVYRACFERATVELTRDGAVTVYEKGAVRKPGRVFCPELTEEHSKEDDSAGINITAQGPYYAEIKDFYTFLLNGQSITSNPLSEGVKSAKLAMRELAAAKAFVGNR